MSAPAHIEIAGIRLAALPEYEPPRLAALPDPDDVDDWPEDLSWVPAPALVSGGRDGSVVWPPKDGPAWNEAGRVRDLLWRLVTVVLEALDGRRPIGQLHGLVESRLYQSLQTRRRQWSSAGRQHRLRSLHTCRPADGIIELCGSVALSSAQIRRPAVIAVAARVERRGDRWRCTALRPLYP